MRPLLIIGHYEHNSTEQQEPPLNEIILTIYVTVLCINYNLLVNKKIIIN